MLNEPPPAIASPRLAPPMDGRFVRARVPASLLCNYLAAETYLRLCSLPLPLSPTERRYSPARSSTERRGTLPWTKRSPSGTLSSLRPGLLGGDPPGIGDPELTSNLIFPREPDISKLPDWLWPNESSLESSEELPTPSVGLRLCC